MHTRVGWGVRVWVGARVRGSGRAASDDAPRTSAASDAGLKCGEQRAGVCVCVCVGGGVLPWAAWGLAWWAVVRMGEGCTRAWWRDARLDGGWKMAAALWLVDARVKAG